MGYQDNTDGYWEHKMVYRPVGTEYGRSSDDPDSSSSLLFVPGKKGVKAQARIRDVEQHEYDSTTRPNPRHGFGDDARTGSWVRDELLRVGVECFIDRLFAAVEPHVERYLSERVVPAMSSAASLARKGIAGLLGRPETGELSDAVDSRSTSSSAFAEEVPFENVSASILDPANPRSSVSARSTGHSRSTRSSGVASRRDSCGRRANADHSCRPRDR